MQIVLLGHYDIASLYALDRVMRLQPEHAYTVFLSGALKEKNKPDARLAELAGFDATLCESFLDGAAGYDVRPELTSPEDLPRPNSAEGLSRLEALQPDLVVSVRYRRILRDDFVRIPAHGVINLHSGILPDYKGVMATFWAMLAGEEEIGATLHRIVDAGIDTGPIIEICRRPTRPAASYLANVIGLYEAGGDAIGRAIRSLAAGHDLAGTEQESGGNYFSIPDRTAVQHFETSGLKLFDDAEAGELVSPVPF